ncbi:MULTISPECIES: iron-siderophore ABC transporter substrate-binding protein [unclassified Pseudomonas]|uniref:ABC transporter substrate-binding protein n=1 Tax=Pseudomonas sp. URMO17WK12:I2 TaxID=1261623 RepID=UPI000DAD3604|nr:MULTISPECIES: iron-siderophore ABC transporter substrate-binding protein [unclassified Pseudomonas]PZW47549.1 iron complex transport system substrate-binding protein [Pseudomonas sp. URMO17WK12:I2]
MIASLSRCSCLLALSGLVALLPLGTAQAASRTVDTAFGALELHGTPQRVVTLSENALDTALAVGVTPLGSMATRGGNDVSTYLKDKAGDIKIVGTARETNLESVFALQPDLILAAPALTRDQYQKLSLIAPTLVPKGNAFADWRQNVEFYGQALDKRPEARAAIAAVDARIEGLKGKIEPGQVASVVRWSPQGPGVMSHHLFVGQLLGQLGFKGTAMAAELTKKPHSDALSLENLSRIDGDWLFLATLNADGDKALEQARQQPAFARLKAVSSGHVQSVDGQIWSSGAGPLAAQVVLDDVEKAVTAQ